MTSVRWASLIAGLAVSATLSCGSALAVPVTLDFTGGNGAQSPLMTFGNAGLNLTVSSNTWNDSGSNVQTAGTVGRWSTGLGVVNSHGDQHFVDGNGKNDVLSFYFSQAVQLVSITFSYNDRNDNFAFFFDDESNNSLAGDLVWSRRDIPGTSFYGTYTFTALESRNAIGRLFGIGAFDADDEFKIASITVNNAPSAVPVPAALPLLLSALGFMGWRARRGKAKAL
jgi:hypothetical protein